ncbi:MSMEG_1061 family FMN-dependent PPOX-type flavoprotein, partial [Methylopila henanensis]
MSANIVETIEQLEAIYGAPAESSLVKQVPRLTAEYRAIIEASPFAALATSGLEGLDCSPRGDGRGFVRIADDRTLILPDRKGNNRIDSLRNVLRDPRVALLFLVPGAGVTLRVNGRAEISVDADLLASFAVDGAAPRTALVISVEAVYFQCARAVIRSKLWDPAGFLAP